MEDDDETTTASDPIGTLASDSPPSPSSAVPGGTAAALEFLTEPPGDVAVRSGGSSEVRLEGERESDGDGVELGFSGIESEQIDTRYVERERERDGGGVAGEGVELGFSGIGTEQIDTRYVDELMENDDAEVAEGAFLEVGSERKSEEEGGEVVGGEMDRQDEVLNDAKVSEIDDVAVEERDFAVVGSERNSGEEGGEENLTVGDEIDEKESKDELVGEVLVDSEVKIGKDDVAVGEGEFLVVGSEVKSGEEGEEEKLTMGDKMDEKESKDELVSEFLVEGSEMKSGEEEKLTMRDKMGEKESKDELVDEFLVVGSEVKSGEEGEEEKLTVGDIMDGKESKDELVGEFLVEGSEMKSGEEGEEEKLTMGDIMDGKESKDELVGEFLVEGSEMKSGEEGEEEKLTMDDKMDGKESKNELVGEFLVEGSEMKSGEEGEEEKLTMGDKMDEKESKDEVVGEFLVVGSEVKSSLDEGERENLSTRAEMVMEIGSESEKGKDGTVLEETEAEIVADDVAVDTELGSEREVGEEAQEGEAIIEELEASQMEVDDEAVKEREDDEDEAMGEEDENLADTEDTDVAEVAEEEKGGKRKRGKGSKVASKASTRKVVEEDVCFICFDGGDLVLCDRRGCPKAYHASCVNRDEAFFRAKGRWNCGWHQCSICEKKNAHYMCYTCPFSLCKACSKDAVISCVRDNKGFCESCMKTVSLIENTEKKGVNEDQVDFDDKSSWLYLFKDYWLNVKEKLSLSAAEISQAKNPSKGSDALAGKRESTEDAVDGSNLQDSSSDSEENIEASKNKRRKTKKRLKSRTKEDTSPTAKEDFPPARKPMRNATFGTEVTFKPVNTEWASKELLEFVMHMKNGDKSAISQFDVQALLLEYIKTNKLRDPRRKSQIICDARLQSLFGKPRVGHFEMLKLLESHFLIKENSQTDDNQGTVVDDESNELDADGTMDTTPKGGKDKRRKTRKKGHNRGRQSNLDDYAAIDMHNIGLIFLRRKLVEDLLEDDESFCDKAVGTFVRIRISASTQKQDMYRLVKVLGTSKAAEPYKVGKRTTDLMLEILNLNKQELVSIDTISNQDFTEEECTRLRQSIKCGLSSRLTVGDVLDKATEIQAARVSDWLESEVVRVSHLRDRASDLGHRKELRECVEKLQLLKTPEERRRRLDEIPEIHADPNMDPDHESEEHDSGEENSKQDSFMKSRGSAFSRRGREPISPRGGNFSSVESWRGSRQNSGKNYEVTRNHSNTGFSNKSDESAFANEGAHRYIETQQTNMERVMSPINTVNAGQSSISFARSDSFSTAAPEIPQPSLLEAAININESEKMWNYKDPAGKVQGPFSIVQLRKWSKNGYFPTDLRIWKTKETEDVSILLTDAMDGIFHKILTKTNPSPFSLSVEVPKQANQSNDSFNPPSPTPNISTPASASSLAVQTDNFTNQNGNQEIISPASLLNSGRQLISNLENGSINSLASSAPVVPNIAQQAPIANETQVWGTQQMVMPYQTAPNGPQTTVNSTGQNLDPNSTYSMPIQQQQAGHNPWLGAVPTMPGYAAVMPNQEQWRQTVPGQQPSFPVQVPPNVPWGMNMVQGNNPNMGWGMNMVQSGTPNMNWTPMVNPGWIAPNQGWVAPPVTPAPGVAPVAQAPPPGTVNSGWGPSGNTSSNQGRNTSSGKGNSGGWNTPSGNSGGRRNEGQRSGSRFSGPRDRGGNDGRQYRPKAHYDSHGNRICPYFLEGHCRKGSRCDMVHQNLPDKM